MSKRKLSFMAILKFATNIFPPVSTFKGIFKPAPLSGKIGQYMTKFAAKTIPMKIFVREYYINFKRQGYKPGI